MDKGVHSVTEIEAKWFCKHRNLKEGNVVLVANYTMTCGSLPMRRVVKCEIDEDCLVRTMMTEAVSRDVRKLCLPRVPE